jgi:vancomycin resistance protein VanJ
MHKWLFLQISSFFWLSLWLFGLSILAIYIMRWWPGDRLLPVRLANYIMPWLLWGLVPALIVSLLGQHSWLMITLTIPTILICFTYVPLFLHNPSVSSADSEPIKIMSYNVWRDNNDMKGVAKVILEEQPDILFLQELKINHARELIKALVNLYPESQPNIAFEPNLLQAVISRYPIISTQALPKRGKAQKVMLRLLKGQITLFNVHPVRQSGWLKRYHQMSSLLEEEIFPLGGPVMLAGDFNTTDQSQIYRLFKKHLHNAHWEGGVGFGFTYPSYSYKLKGKVTLPSIVRIDHIFYSNHFSVIRAGTLKKSGGSDHLPVTAELAWKADRNSSGRA